MKLLASVRSHLPGEAFWAGFWATFSFDITGRTQAAAVREVLERSDAEALAEDVAALRRDWRAAAQDMSVPRER